MYPGYHASKPVPMCVAPTLPSWSSRCAIAMPIMFSWREMTYGACVAIGSANGGSQMRVGNGDDWWCT